MREAESETAAVSSAPGQRSGLDDPHHDDETLPFRTGDAVDGEVEVDLRDLGSGVALGAENDDEGETQVDVRRSAEALQKLRSYREAPPFPASPLWPPVVKPAYRSAGGLPLGRPAGAMTVAPSPQPALLLPPPPEVSRLSVSFEGEVFRRRNSVGRRMGILIAAATAVSVALAVGAWTARTGFDPGAATLPSPSGGEARTTAAAHPRPPRVTAVVVPTRPVEAVPARSPATEEASRQPVPERAPVPQPSRRVGSGEVSSSLGGETGRRSWGPLAKNSRHVRKVARRKARHPRSPGAVNVGVAGSTRRGLTGVIRPAEAMRSGEAIRAPIRDPDATLPFTE